MSLYLRTKGRAHLSIAICDRCRRKRPWDALGPDPNNPGLRVCADQPRGSRACMDDLDPYRLPARQPEDVTLPWTRPDEAIVPPPVAITDLEGEWIYLMDEAGNILAPSDGAEVVPGDTLDVDLILDWSSIP